MSDLAVDFEWYRSDYDFVAPTNPPSVSISRAYIDKPWALAPWIEEERETGALFGKIVARGPIKKIYPDAHRLDVALRTLTTIKRNTLDEALFEFRVTVPTMARALGMLDHMSEAGGDRNAYGLVLLSGNTSQHFADRKEIKCLREKIYGREFSTLH